MTECQEIARSIGLHPKTFDQALSYTRQEMPGESETIISNVAWSLYVNSSQRIPVWFSAVITSTPEVGSW